MRVPQGKKFSVGRKGYAVILACAVVGVIGTALFGHSPKRTTDPVIAPVAAYNPSSTPATTVTMATVVIATESLHTGEFFEATNVSTTSRPIDSLPEDAITSIGELNGRVAFGSISPQSVITRSLVGSEVAVVDATRVEDSPALIDEVLASLSKRLMRVDVNLVGPAPLRGSRIALSFSPRAGATPILVSSDAWVFSSTNKRAAVLVTPGEASILRGFPSTAEFNAVILRPGDNAEEALRASIINSAPNIQ